MSAWSVAWLVWLAVFVVLETVALLNGTPDDTLSEHIWRWAGLHASGVWAAIRRAILAGALGWLVVHFLSAGRV
ncbi:hypothetical protein [Streptomyces sp. NPDC057301]|uniref:hypothetical protein n=1 Tax=Streptomyces sp. NPDC057301 TaxID=3346093 RepID=UPI00363B6CDF